jgi:hypothetical protein
MIDKNISILQLNDTYQVILYNIGLGLSIASQILSLDMLGRLQMQKRVHAKVAEDILNAELFPGEMQ